MPRAKAVARARGLSLSQLIEDSLRDEIRSCESLSFSERWRGRFVLAPKDDERYRALAARYR